MRIFALAVVAGSVSLVAWAGVDGTTSFQKPAAAPPTAKMKDRVAGTGKIGAAASGGTKASQDLTFRDIEGAWTGTVDEVDQDPYIINLTFRPGGLGEVSYSGYNCDGVLSAVSEGAKLVFKETITTRRDICADGTVVITPRGLDLNWTWINQWNEVQATAVLTRKP